LSELEEALFHLIDGIESPSLRASMTDLSLRLFSCLSDPHLESAYLDMANTIPYMADVLLTIDKPGTSQALKREAYFKISFLCDLARVAINQRYAGLETHPETLAHSQSPVLSDIRSLISAASSLPHFLFTNLFPTQSNAKSVWSGYVVFGTTYSHQWYPQDILALPSNAISDPVSEWWKLTHETAHAIFKLLKLETRIPKQLYELVQDGFDGTSVSTTHALQEVFANWFDWRYVFDRDTAFFLQAVWKSWLKLPVVLQNPRQYLVRTFTIFLAEDFEAYHQAFESESETFLREYMQRRWDAFTDCIGKTASPQDFKLLTTRFSPPVLRDVFDEATILIQAIYFYEDKLENICHVRGLYDRLNPAYPRLKAHVLALERGEIISDPIPNPCKLELELLRNSVKRPITLETQAAFVFSLQNNFIKATQS